MNLTPFVDDLQNQLRVAAQAGGDEAREIAERLIAPLESSSRLVMLEALAAAASEITRDLAPGAVDLRLRGRDPEFVVSLPSAAATESASAPILESPPPPPPPPDFSSGEDASTARITLRLPDQLKQRMEQAAEREGLSVNSWLLRAVATALEPRARRSEQNGPGGGQRFTGWVR